MTSRAHLKNSHKKTKTAEGWEYRGFIIVKRGTWFFVDALDLQAPRMGMITNFIDKRLDA